MKNKKPIKKRLNRYFITQNPHNIATSKSIDYINHRVMNSHFLWYIFIEFTYMHESKVNKNRGAASKKHKCSSSSQRGMWMVKKQSTIQLLDFFNSGEWYLFIQKNMTLQFITMIDHLNFLFQPLCCSEDVPYTCHVTAQCL